MFLLKKFFAPLFFPYSLCLEILLLGLFLLWFTRKQKGGKITVTLSVLLLICFGYGPISHTLIGSVENEYPPLHVVADASTHNELDRVKWIVVLGGGHAFDDKLPASGQLSGPSLARLVEGVRIYRGLPERKLLLSGGGDKEESTDAEMMERTALLLGVNDQDIVLEKDSRDTDDQARLLRPILGSEAFIMVTSATHMPRAMGLFRKQGMEPIPAPCDYLAKGRISFGPGIIYPGAGGLNNMERVFYEYFGLGWGKLRGQI